MSAPEVLDALAFLAQDADQVVAVESVMRFEVDATPQGYAVREEGRVVAVVAEPGEVLDVLFVRVHNRAYEHASNRGWVRLHAGCVTVAGRRFLAVGHSGAGKTTLMLRLLFDGARVEGDEFVLLRAGEVVAYPRPLHLKRGMDRVIPEIGQIMERAPRLAQEPPVWAFDPSAFGHPWVIEVGHVDAVLLLERGDGPRCSIEPVSATGVMQEIIEQVYPLHEPKSAIVREVANLLRTTPCFRLRMGDVTEASRLLHELEV